ncbi:hypothetical protein B0O99DRAFT_684021 [Bisporella sp. PMI_857]|nr:hypothetical protein B0O99DRAFT_684021 [Bisporella sp. PMI_857]
MEVELESYRDRFAGIRAGLTGEVDRGMVLIEELLMELDSTKTILKKAQLDLDNESETRRRLQQEVKKGRELGERQGRRPFIVALIDADADCYVFHDQFIARGEKGGEDAADALLAALQQFVRGLAGEPNEMDIMVRAFANLSGLGAALRRDGRLRDKDELRAFATGFSSRQAFFDFVDIGPGKERADLKVRESIKFFLETFQCKHLVLACGHDDGYAPWLGQFVGDKQVVERITLLEGSPFPAKMRNLGLRTTRFSSVFNNVTQPAVSASLVGPAWGRAITPTVAEAVADRGSNSERLLTAGSVHLGGPAGHNPQAQLDRLGPVLTNHAGRRIDRPLQVNKVVVERIKKCSLCYYFYLRGKCTTKCLRNHLYRSLTDEEFDALWEQARQGRCSKSRKVDREGGDDCSDAMCIYGHGSRAG